VILNAERIRQLRIEQGCSQEKLAEIANVNRRTIQRAESGQPVSLETVDLLADALGVDKSEIRSSIVASNQPIQADIVKPESFIEQKVQNSITEESIEQTAPSSEPNQLADTINNNNLVIKLLGGAIVGAIGFIVGALLWDGPLIGIAFGGIIGFFTKGFVKGCIYWVVFVNVLQFFFLKGAHCVFVAEGSLVGTTVGHLYQFLVVMPGIIGTLMHGIVFGTLGIC